MPYALREEYLHYRPTDAGCKELRQQACVDCCGRRRKAAKYHELVPACGIIATRQQTLAAGMSKDSPIQFKGTSLKIIQTHLRTTDLAALYAGLAELTGNSADFFEGDLAVLDFSNAEALPDHADWTQIAQLLRGSGLTPIATLD